MKELIKKLERLKKGFILIGTLIDAETIQEAITALQESELNKQIEDFEEEDDEVAEPDYYQCMCCGVAQEFSHNCKHCAGPLSEGYF